SLDLISSGFDAVRQGQYRANTAAAEIARAGAPVNPAAAGSVPLQAATAQPVASTAVESNRPVGMVSALVALEQARPEVEAGAPVPGVLRLLASPRGAVRSGLRGLKEVIGNAMKPSRVKGVDNIQAKT